MLGDLSLELILVCFFVKRLDKFVANFPLRVGVSKDYYQERVNLQ
jgi:hypothetical protein